MHLDCPCGAPLDGDDLDGLTGRFLAHVRSVHPDWPYSDTAVRNFAHATQRLTGGSERLDAIGDVEVHLVTEDRLDDWAAFFDHDGFVGNPQWAACYCVEPLDVGPEATGTEVDDRTWEHNRAAMLGYLRSGRATGYLAYVDGRPAGWVNASKRSSYSLFADVDPEGPDGGDVVGLSCFVIAPPYRRHGLAGKLLDRVVADAAGRGVSWVEAYPFTAARPDDGTNFRGPRSLYDARGFEPVEERGRYAVVRRRVVA